jgi:hypothetical protein
MSFGITLPFMLYGVYRAVRIHIRERRLIATPAGLLLLFVVVYVGIHILSWSLVRYRLPVDSVLIIFAGYAVYELFAARFNSTELV